MRRSFKRTLAYIAAAALSLGTFGITPVYANEAIAYASTQITKPGVPTLSHDNWDGTGEFKVMATLWSNATATKATLYQNGVKIAEKPLTPTATGSQNVDFELKPIYNDTYTYYVVYSNEAGESQSKELIVEVTKGKKYPAPPRTEPNTNGKRIVMYYPEWGIYAGHDNWMPQDIPWEYITHMNYAFFTIQGISRTIGDQVPDHEVKFFDKFAALEADAGTGEPYGSEYKGVVGAMRTAKREHSHVRMMMSIGGWSQSANFVEASATPEARKIFADSAIRIMREYEFDGLDIDWEYPAFPREGDTKDNPNDQGNPRASDADIRNFTLLMKDLRAALDQAGEEDGVYYELSAAVGCGIDKMQKTEVSEYAKYLDFINLMTYDMHGAWEEITGHQSPMYGRTEEQGNPYDEVVSQYTVVQSVNNFLAEGVPADKLVVGIPYYTRGWGGVEPEEIIPGLPGLHAKAQRNATGSFAPSQPGIFDGGVYAGNNPYYYIEEVLEKDPSFTKYWDPIALVPYLYSADKKIFYTYDDPQSIGIKLDYINANNLGGTIVWEATCERQGNPVLTRQMFKAFEGNQNPLPVPPALSSDKTVVRSGETYTLSAHVIANSAATSYEVLENGKVIETGKLTNEAKVIRLPISQDKVGTYKYQVILKNSVGSRSSNEVTVSVKDATDPQTAPVIKGVGDQKIKVGDVFDPMKGVTAVDQKEGDLTHQIKVTNTVDTSKEGVYTVTYTVTNSQGLSTTVSCKVTVEKTDSTTPDGTYDPKKVYNSGDTVIYDGVEYTAKWWTQGEIPGKSAVWEQKVEANPDGSIPYVAGKAYVGGDVVTYNGMLYKAKWWTNTTPGSDGSWQLVN